MRDSAALASVLGHPAIWRGSDCAPEPAALSSGFPVLDRVLPGGGWPQAALTEVLLTREGIGEMRLTLPALKNVQAQGRDVVWIAPPHRPYAPALAAAGLDLTRLLIVRCRDAKEALWAYEQSLRAPECGAAFAWLATHDERCLRRLQVAAREGRTWAMLWRRPGQHGHAQAAALRLALAPHDGGLAIRVLKRRGAELPQPIVVNLDRASGAPTFALPEGAPARVDVLRPAPHDPRTSAGAPGPQPRRRVGAKH
ncbi:MAG TPA: translesion DNA synthesis-associated protein ImuA [Casimicrobiaceae bacterium]|nr:translesion DNA synthesis-associated protein ImuA [Casimicrobiaceae bacterium]